MFESRISEMADCRVTQLAPTWDCKLPLNVNDSDLRPEMTEPPLVQAKITDSVFAVLRSELADFIRNTQFHLSFTNPALKSVARKLPKDGHLDYLENMAEENYLQYCDSGNPLHYMTIWTTRAYIARCRLFENYSRSPTPPMNTSEYETDAALAHALKMLECDTRVLNAPFAKGYQWLRQLYFPFVAYVHIVKDVAKRPFNDRTSEAWEVMSDNYDARFRVLPLVDNAIFRMFTRVILQGYSAYEHAVGKRGEQAAVPRIVSNIRQTHKKIAEMGQSSDAEQENGVMDMRIDDFLMPMPMNLNDHGLANGMIGNQVPDFRTFPNALSSSTMPTDMDHLSWDPMGWGLGQ